MYAESYGSYEAGLETFRRSAGVLRCAECGDIHRKLPERRPRARDCALFETSRRPQNRPVHKFLVIRILVRNSVMAELDNTTRD